MCAGRTNLGGRQADEERSRARMFRGREGVVGVVGGAAVGVVGRVGIGVVAGVADAVGVVGVVAVVLESVERLRSRWPVSVAGVGDDERPEVLLGVINIGCSVPCGEERGAAAAQELMESFDHEGGGLKSP